MILFIDRLPLEGWFAFLPMMAVDPGRTAARPKVVQVVRPWDRASDLV
jgi:hypothetical protein